MKKWETQVDMFTFTSFSQGPVQPNESDDLWVNIPRFNIEPPPHRSCMQAATNFIFHRLPASLMNQFYNKS